MMGLNMGEANRRGNKAERVAKALEGAEDFDIFGNIDAVDEDLYLYCSNIYSAAAQMTMPVENPESKKILISDDKAISFRDIPINRGCLAVNKELIEMGVEAKVRRSMLARIMQFGDVLKPNPLIDTWLKPGDTQDELNVAESLIRACARANIVVVDNSLRFDLADVARLSAEIEVRLDAEDNLKEQHDA